MMNANLRPTRRFNARRTAVVAGLGVFLVYVLFVVTGFVWVNFGLKNRHITFAQVALFRWKEVRRDMAVQQLAQAQAAWNAKDPSAAYLAFTSAVRNDPNNVEARCQAARFFVAVGAPKDAISLLEAGLDLAPTDRQLMTQLLAILTTEGRDARALELLHGRYATQLAGSRDAALPTYEVLATLNAQGADAAKQLLKKYPAIQENSESAPVVARVLWESGDRLKAMDVLAEYLRGGRGDVAPYALLATWQTASGMSSDARQTAERACARFPNEIPPRIALIDVLPVDSPEWRRAVEAYLNDFGNRAESIPSLADLAGRRGWVGLARTLYAVGASRLANLHLLAMAYSDALARNSQFPQARQVLAQLEAQTADNDSHIGPLLRNRQIVIAAALGDHEGTREFARRLATALRGDPGAIELQRRRFAQLRIPEAVDELSHAAGPSGASLRQ
jgi:thioredoxin-like negative regulator of GroEL